MRSIVTTSKVKKDLQHMKKRSADLDAFFSVVGKFTKWELLEP
jgi:hypothetical protein